MSGQCEALSLSLYRGRVGGGGWTGEGEQGRVGGRLGVRAAGCVCAPHVLVAPHARRGQQAGADALGDGGEARDIRPHDLRRQLQHVLQRHAPK